MPCRHYDLPCFAMSRKFSPQIVLGFQRRIIIKVGVEIGIAARQEAAKSPRYLALARSVCPVDPDGMFIHLAAACKHFFQSFQQVDKCLVRIRRFPAVRMGIKCCLRNFRWVVLELEIVTIVGHVFPPN